MWRRRLRTAFLRLCGKGCSKGKSRQVREELWIGQPEMLGETQKRQPGNTEARLRIKQQKKAGQEYE